MNPTYFRRGGTRVMLALMCSTAIAPGVIVAYAQSPSATAAAAPQDAARIPQDQLDSLVAPIALYPDPLLAQTLAASTYPLELMQLHQWLQRNSTLKDKALADAAAKQPWDPSIQAMAALPDVVKRLTDDIQWTTDLGNAFLAQQSDVMDAVQRMRQKAQGTGSLKTTNEQLVETQVIENKSVIVIEQSDPQVVYVPSYNPVTVYGPPVYPYPSIYYPPPGYYAAGRAISFGVGVAMGAAWGHGGWGWNAGWGHNDIDINRNNTFVRNNNINSARTGAINNARTGTRSNTWQHNPGHRGGTPYRDNATANRFGGTARGDSLNNRQTAARQQIQQRGGNLSSARSGATGTSGRSVSGQGQFGGNAANRASGAGAGNRASGLSNRSGSAAGLSDRSSTGAAGLSNRSSGGGADRIGQRDLSRSGSGQSAFGGSRDAASARANSSRGASSYQSRGGSGSRSGSFSGSRSGGASRGGGRSGGSRGGGRRR